jgi:hypothetical protein
MTKYEILLAAPEFYETVRYVVHYADPEPKEAESEEEYHVRQNFTMYFMWQYKFQILCRK